MYAPVGTFQMPQYGWQTFAMTHEDCSHYIQTVVRWRDPHGLAIVLLNY